MQENAGLVGPIRLSGERPVFEHFNRTEGWEFKLVGFPGRRGACQENCAQQGALPDWGFAERRCSLPLFFFS